jgi:hypothetical protein
VVSERLLRAKSMTRTFEYKLFADYHQFYLQDEGVDGNLGDSWTPEATARDLAVAPGAIGIGTVRNATVPVVIEIADGKPDDNMNSWDQVTECSMEVASGRLVVAGCTDYFPDAARIEIPPGSYRARIYSGNLDSLSDDGLDGDDHYRVVLWSAAPGPVLILKPYTGSRIRPTLES